MSELFSDECYLSSDIDVLRDIRDSYEFLSDQLLFTIGNQTWTNGRLTSLDLTNMNYSYQDTSNLLLSLPKSIKNLSSLVNLNLSNIGN